MEFWIGFRTSEVLRRAVDAPIAALQDARNLTQAAALLEQAP